MLVLSWQNRNTMRTLKCMSALLATGLLFAACSPKQEAENTKEKVDSGIQDLNADLRADLDKSKLELTENLRELKLKTEAKIADFDSKLENDKLSLAERKELETARQELKEQVTRIDAATSKVGLATRDTWLEVKDETKKVTDDVGNWFERQAEKIDKDTKADHDGDGH